MDSTIRYSLKLASVAAMIATLTGPIVAAAQLSKAGGATAGFHALGPAGLKIDGTTSDLSVADDGSTITVAVPLNNISTGIGLRDKHTKEYLEVQKYPIAELRVSRGALKMPAAGAQSSGEAKGTLKIHGQSKEVAFRYAAKRDGDVYAVAGSARINMNEFGVKTPSYLGVSVKPDVEVFANFQVKGD